MNNLAWNSYWHSAKTGYYSIVLTLPLLILYEVLLYFEKLSSSKNWQVRNAVDAWIRELFAVFEIGSQHAFMIMIIGLCVALPFLARRSPPLKAYYVIGIILESLIYSLLFGAVVQFILFKVFLAMPSGSSVVQNFAMSLGAGIFEEFFFSVCLN